MNKYTTCLKKYRIYIWTYGIVSVLKVMKHFQELENYEECKKIIDAIKSHETELGIILFTELTNKNIESCMSYFKEHGLTTEEFMDHTNYYSEYILQEIKEKHAVK